jgi:hypothetical protein
VGLVAPGVAAPLAERGPPLAELHGDGDDHAEHHDPAGDRQEERVAVDEGEPEDAEAADHGEQDLQEAPGRRGLDDRGRRHRHRLTFRRRRERSRGPVEQHRAGRGAVLGGGPGGPLARGRGGHRSPPVISRHAP